MRFLPDTITSRTVAVLLIGLIAFHAVSICAYQIGLDNEVDLTNEVRLAERLITIKRALAGLPSQYREDGAFTVGGTARSALERRASDRSKRSCRREDGRTAATPPCARP